jgi:hypothetical protein
MSRSLLDDAFAHHVWAFGVQTSRVVEVPPTSSPR